MITRWSGRETRALRQALRLSVRDFAQLIGVSHRMISKWEAAGTGVRPRPANQAALDTAFSCADDDAKARFLDSLHQPPPPADLVLPAVAAIESVRHPIDEKIMVAVDEGVFLSGPQNKPTWLDRYLIDVYPVTNSDYRRFIDQTNHPCPAHWSDGTHPDALSDHPVVQVTWRDASAYASWAGKVLPTSLQWEKAARGSAGNVWPWGSQATFAKCNVRESGLGHTTNVDRYGSGVSPYGAYDMCGNVWEWCATETMAGRRELRGSAFTSPFERAMPSMFNDAEPDMKDDDTGFRCVWSGSAPQDAIVAADALRA